MRIETTYAPTYLLTHAHPILIETICSPVCLFNKSHSAYRSKSHLRNDSQFDDHKVFSMSASRSVGWIIVAKTLLCSLMKSNVVHVIFVFFGYCIGYTTLVFPALVRYFPRPLTENAVQKRVLQNVHGKKSIVAWKCGNRQLLSLCIIAKTTRLFLKWHLAADSNETMCTVLLLAHILSTHQLLDVARAAGV